MEVIDDNAALLSNYEVYSLLQDIQGGKNGQKKPNKSQNNLSTILYSTLKVLEKTPAKDQSSEIIEAFMQRVERFNLTKAEKLQLLNQRPTSAVEIQLLIEESEERMSEEQIEELLDVITQCLPGDDPTPEEVEDDDDDDEQSPA